MLQAKNAMLAMLKKTLYISYTTNPVSILEILQNIFILAMQQNYFLC